MDLDQHTDQRIKRLENWMPRAERRLADVERGLGENTRITSDTNRKVTEMWDYWTAGKINVRLFLVLTAIFGSIGASVAGVISWLHR